MKTILRYTTILLFYLVSITGVIAQEENQNLLIKLDYMKVKPGNSNAYIDLELNHWKALHEQRVKSGNIVRWVLYRIHLSGTGSEYNYATATFYDDFGKIDDNWFSDTVGTLGMDDDAVDQMRKKTIKARSLVKSEIWRQLESIDPVEPAKIFTVGYMDAAPGKEREYVNLEREIAQPNHQANVDAGNKLGWGLYSLSYPSGTSQPYDYATVNIYRDYDDIVDRSERVDRSTVYPGKDQEWVRGMWQKLMQSRSTVTRQLWEVVAIVDASTISEGK